MRTWIVRVVWVALAAACPACDEECCDTVTRVAESPYSTLSCARNQTMAMEAFNGHAYVVCRCVVRYDGGLASPTLAR